MLLQSSTSVITKFNERYNKVRRCRYCAETVCRFCFCILFCCLFSVCRASTPVWAVKCPCVSLWCIPFLLLTFRVAVAGQSRRARGWRPPRSPGRSGKATFVFPICSTWTWHVSIHNTSELCFSRDLIASSISEYQVLYTSWRLPEEKMARDTHFIRKYLGIGIKLVLYILKQLFASVSVNSGGYLPRWSGSIIIHRHSPPLRRIIAKYPSRPHWSKPD